MMVLLSQSPSHCTLYTHTRACVVCLTLLASVVSVCLCSHTRPCGLSHTAVWYCCVGWLAMHTLQDELPNPPGIPAFPYAPSAEDHCGAAQPILTWKRENLSPIPYAPFGHAPKGTCPNTIARLAKCMLLPMPSSTAQAPPSPRRVAAPCRQPGFTSPRLHQLLQAA